MILSLLIEAFDGVLHKAADGHRADAAGNRRDDGCLRGYGIEVHVPAEFPFLVQIHPYIDNGSTFLNHISGHELRPAYGDDQDICVPGI